MKADSRCILARYALHYMRLNTMRSIGFCPYRRRPQVSCRQPDCHSNPDLNEDAVNELHRCAWAESDPLLRAYHDEEWGVPQHDSRALWELLMLEGFQAGLAWITVLRKRDAFRKAFHHFDPKKVGAYTELDITRLLDNPGIIRSRAKIEATIAGARIYEEMKRNGEDFSAFVWKLAGGKPIKSKNAQVPA